MKKSRKTRSLRAVFCAFALSASASLPLTSCGATNADWTAHDNYKIYVIGQSENVDFWNYVEQGAKECARDMEFEVIYHNAQSVSDVEGQKTLINDAIANDADAIVISANSESGLNETLRNATDKNISIITINADVTYDKRICYIGTDNRSSGAMAGRHAAAKLVEMQELSGDALPGRIGIICHSQDASSAIDRIEGFSNQITASMKGLIMPVIYRELAVQAAMKAGGGQGGAPGDEEEGGEDAAPNAEGNETGTTNGEGGAPEGQGDAPEGQGGAPEGQGGANEGQEGAPEGQGGSSKGQGGQSGQTSPEMAEAAEALYNEKYAPIVDIQDCEGSADKAKEQAKAMLAEHSDIKLLFATNERSTIGVCEAIEELGMAGKIAVIGYNSNDSEINYIKTGTLSGTILQNPYNIGYLGAYYAFKAIKGDELGKSIDTGTIYATLDNLNSPQVQLVLDPAGYVSKN